MTEQQQALPPLLLPRSSTAIAGLAASVINAVMRVAVIPVFVTPLIDQVVARNELASLVPLLSLAALLVIAGSVALWAQDALLGRAAARVAERWREILYRRLLARSPGTLPGSSGGLAARVLHDLREVETYYQFGLGTLVAESATILGVLAVLAISNWQATILLIVLFLPLVLVLKLVGGRLERMAERSQEGTEEVGGHLQEGLRHHEVLRAFGASEFAVGRFAAANRKTAAAMSSRAFIAGAQIPITQVLAFAAVGALVAMLASLASTGGMTVGQLVTFITLVALLSAPAQLLPKGVAMAQQARAASLRLRRLAEAPEPREVEQVPEPERRATPWLELRGVDLGYENGTILRDMSLRLPGPGLTVLIGESGSGKTTLLRLLLRFLQPTKGQVLLHGVPLEAWPEPAFRRAVAYVPQGHELMRGSVRDNLTLGRPVADGKLWQVLDEVLLGDALRATPTGLDHLLKEDGAGLSGGQRQRVAIARALLTEPSLLLLDEPTSNLDEAAENDLVSLLRQQAANRLVLAVTHRPALAMAATCLYRLAEGGIEVADLSASR